VAVATAPFGAPGLYSDWGRISLTSTHSTAHARDKSLAPEADCAVRVGRGCIRPTAPTKADRPIPIMPLKRVCKPNCKPTTRHRTVSGIIGRHRHGKIGELDRTLSYCAARARTNVLELESRCAVHPYRGLESHRHDYYVEIAGGTPGARYIEGYEEVSGIMFPTKRRIFPRQSSPEPLLPKPGMNTFPCAV